MLLNLASEADDLRGVGNLMSADATIVQPEARSSASNFLVSFDGEDCILFRHHSDVGNLNRVSVTGDRFVDLVVKAIDRSFFSFFSESVWVDQALTGTSDYAPLAVELADRFCGFVGKDTLCP